MCIITSFRKVPNPFFWFIVTLLLNSEISNSKTTSGEQRNVKFHCNWRFCPNFIVLSWSRVNYSCQNVLLITLEFFDSPHYCRFITLIFSFSSTMLENFNISRILRNWNFNHDIVSHIGMFINSSDLNGVFNSIIFRKLLDDWCNFER